MAARLRAAWRGATPDERRHTTGLTIAIAVLHVLGFGLLLIAASRHVQLAGGAIFGIGLGTTAYVLGARHAFDADHIGAIDNVTRKLMGEGRRPIAVGFFFAAGHSTVVVALGLLVALGVRGLGGALESDSSTLHQLTGVWGPVVAGSFLLIVGVFNLRVFVSTARLAGRVNRGDAGAVELERAIVAQGPFGRFYRRAAGAIRHPWQMYPLGLMFGLGFDTATEVGLLVLAGGAAASGLPFYAVLCLPILFAAGMTLFDTLNSLLMRVAYGWAFTAPARRVAYNLTVTGISVAFALSVGAITLASAVVEQTGLQSGPLARMASIDLAQAGYFAAGSFGALWLAAAAVWRLRSTGHRSEPS